jgi:hypothetical protein
MKAWPESSWKKYFGAYLFEERRYFSYPYQSYTTNFSDPGGHHISNHTNLHQVPMSLSTREVERLRLPDGIQKAVRYDSFYELEPGFFEKSLGIAANELSVDLYGSKPQELINSFRFSLTSRQCRRASSKFPLACKPVENNILLGTDHQKSEFFSLAEPKYINFKNRKNHLLLFEHLSYGQTFSLKLLAPAFLEALKRRIRNMR